MHDHNFKTIISVSPLIVNTLCEFYDFIMIFQFL